MSVNSDPPSQLRGQSPITPTNDVPLDTVIPKVPVWNALGRTVKPYISTVVIVVVVALCSWFVNSNNQARHTRLEARLTIIEKDIVEIRNDIVELKTDVSDIQQTVAELKDRVGYLEGRVNGIDSSR